MTIDRDLRCCSAASLVLLLVASLVGGDPPRRVTSDGRPRDGRQPRTPASTPGG